jgi:hypothetical protein
MSLALPRSQGPLQDLTWSTSSSEHWRNYLQTRQACTRSPGQYSWPPLSHPDPRIIGILNMFWSGTTNGMALQIWAWL